MNSLKKEIIERSVKQFNTYGNGIGVLVTREAKAINLKSGSKVQVSAVRTNGKEYIVFERRLVASKRIIFKFLPIIGFLNRGCNS